MHTLWGARLFKNQTSELDRMSMEIALCHHEKFGGGGYPAWPGRCLESDEQEPLLEREDIPLPHVSVQCRCV